MEVHVYRNRADDHRTASELHFCVACLGWYGVPHMGSHCQQGIVAAWRSNHCACAWCRSWNDKPVQGTYGFFTEAEEWQPPLTSESKPDKL